MYITNWILYVLPFCMLYIFYCIQLLEINNVVNTTATDTITTDATTTTVTIVITTTTVIITSHQVLSTRCHILSLMLTYRL